MKLQSKLALSMAAAASVAIFLMASAFWVLAAREQRRSVDDFLLTRIEQVRNFNEGRGPQQGRGPRGDNTNAFDQNVLLRFRFVGPNGQVLVDDGLPEVAATSDAPRFSTIDIDGDRYRMVDLLVGQGDRQATFQVAQNIEDTEQGLDRLRQRILLGSILGIALAALFGALTAKRLSTPIRQVSAAAREMAIRQDLPSRIAVDRADEVGDLANSFNQMLAALEVSRDQQQRLVADASHELRTPLTSLRLKIELLDSTPDLPVDQRQQLLTGATVELVRLTDLVSELVELATDPTSVDEPATEVDLLGLATEVVDRARRTTEHTITLSGQPGSAIVRPRMVRRAISNLIDNAVKYSTPQTPIAVLVDNGRIEVTDHGDGIAPAELEHIFDRFYRSPSARTRPGNGIGLAIVKHVAELHGGRVWATSEGSTTVGFSVETLDGDESTRPAG